MSRAVDPGWGEAIAKAPRILLPTRGMRLAIDSPDGLTVMRVLWLTFVAAVMLLGVVVVLIDLAAPGGGADGRIVAAGVGVLGLFLQVVSVKFVPEVSGSTMNAVRESAQRGFFIRVAFAEPVGLLGFMGFVLSGNVAVYALGAVICLAGMYDAAPTARWIEESEKSLRASGSDVEFLPAIVGGGITR